ncbi:MAG: glutamate--tRNA ligase family protein, partial [Bacillus subtilis]|nr:glutamate--tRNA ligase family protein [Bacillus subtilis]
MCTSATPRAICLNFGLARELRRRVPPALRRHQSRSRKSSEYVDAIIDDVRWLGFDWKRRRTSSTPPTTSSSMYRCAEPLIQNGLRLRRRPDAPTRCARTAARSPSPARTRPCRDRAVDGEPATCSARCAPASSPTARMMLRAKIDMASPEHQHARPGDLPHPARADHHSTGDKWCIYPMYDLRAPDRTRSSA